MSYGEAKAVYRGAYLHWHRGTHQRRCWGLRERKSNGARAQGRITFAPPVPEPDVILPPEPWNLLDHPAWAWVEMARFRPSQEEPWDEPVIGGLGVIFSTFQGEEPDVWPQLETETASPWWGLAAGALAALLLAVGWFSGLTAVGVRPSSSR